MMNPQPNFLPPGQNNNAPSNPLGFPPTSQAFNAQENNFNQVPTNGPQTAPNQFMQTDIQHKMQNINLNGPQGFPTSQLPPGQLPPMSNLPPASNFQGQMPQQKVHSTSQPQFPPTSAPLNPQFSQAPGVSQGHGFTTSQTATQMHNMPKPPSHTPSSASDSMRNSQIPPHSQSALSLQSGVANQGNASGLSRSAMPPHSVAQPPSVPSNPNQVSQPLQGGTHQGMPQMLPPGQGPLVPTLPGQTSQQQQIQMARPSGPPQPGPIGQPQPPPPTSLGFAPQHSGNLPNLARPGMPQQSSNPGQPPQPTFLPSGGLQGPTQHSGIVPHSNPQAMNQQAGLPQHPGSQVQSQSGNLSYPGPHMSQQPNIPSHPGHQNQNFVPNIPPPLNQQAPQPGPPHQGQHPGSFQQPGFPQQSGHQVLPPNTSFANQPGFPQKNQLQGQPGHGQPNMPPQPAQPGFPPNQMQGQPQGYGQMPPTQGQQQYNQQQSMPNLPHMPPPVAQQYQYAPQPGMMPPQPAYPGGPGAASGYPPQQPPFPAQQPSHPGQQQQHQLNPDHLPSPIDVMADDQKERGGVFVTNGKGVVPPLVTTDFVVDDKGNASPRYIRSSMYSVPVTGEMLKMISLPFCLMISPMAEVVGAEAPPPLLDMAALTGSPTLGPVRCSRCKAYMCPFMKFVDAARHFRCAFCKATTEVPMEYSQYVSAMQQYGRVPAEMALGAYEFVATKEYCRNGVLPNAPALLFLVDVSYNAVRSGLLQTVCDGLEALLAAIPRDEASGAARTRVGFITYSSSVHFYNIKGSRAQPQMLSVGDVRDVFVPLLEGFLALPEESGPVLQALRAQLPAVFGDTKETETLLLPAVQAGMEALRAADAAGQLLVFHTSLPSLDAPGRLANREDRKLLGTDKEAQMLAPQTAAYNELGQLCAAAGVAVELFLCPNSYVDVATVGQLARLTGGAVHKYAYFTAELDGARLLSDAVRVVSRPTGFDAVMRVRTSTGVRPTDFHGHFFMSNTTDVELAAIDCDAGIGVELKHDDKLTGEEAVSVQAALLYTHRSGQRRLRVLNLALGLAHSLADAFRALDQDTTLALLHKQAVAALRSAPPRQVRASLTARAAKALALYRRECAAPSSAAQLVMPEALKLLPLYCNCLLRSDALHAGPDLTVDERACASLRALRDDVPAAVARLYPRLLPLHRVAPDAPPPAPLRASADKLSPDGIYLLENGVHMLLWVGSQAPAELLQQLLGVSSAQAVEARAGELPELDNPYSQAVRALVRRARDKQRCAMRLTIMRQHDKLEAVLRQFLVEDRGVDGSASYVDFLCHLHKEIRALL